MNQRPKIAIIGAGAAGLMAADKLSDYCADIYVYEQMPTAARKILWAGKTGLNVSHNEPMDVFISRYTPSDWLAPYIKDFGAVQICKFMADLGIKTYVGSSGRIFPVEMKASQFVRAQLRSLNTKGVRFFYWHELLEIKDDELTILNKKTNTTIIKKFDAIILACGGGSYKRLGSTGTWQTWFDDWELSPLYASNVGIIKTWSPYMADNFGKPIKHISAWADNGHGNLKKITGDIIITHYGLESGVIYALNQSLRNNFQNNIGVLYIDLLPDMTEDNLISKLLQLKKSKQSLSNSLRKIGLSPEKIALIRECTPKAD